MATIVARQARAFSSTAFQPAKITSSPLTTQVFRPINNMHLFSSSSGGGGGVADFGELKEKIVAKGNEIRQLKADGIEKADLAPHVEELLALKAQLPEEEQDKPKKEKKPKKKNTPAKKKAPPKKVEEMSESELRLNRLSKVDAMREADIEPFEYTFDQTRSAAALIAEYDGKLEGGEEDEESDVAVAGRIMTRRVFGKLAFFTLQDETGTIQLQFDKTRLGETFKVSNTVGQPLRIKSWWTFGGNAQSLLPRYAFVGNQGLYRWW